MQRQFIQRLRIHNYGCVRNAELKLTPLHALIGPNDSGKSTVLLALRTLTTLAAGPLEMVEDDGRILQAMSLSPKFALEVASGDRKWNLNSSGPNTFHEILVPDVSGALMPRYGSMLLRSVPDFQKVLAGSLLLRLEPDALRMPTHLIPDEQPLRFMNELGLGLPALYDAIVTRNMPAFVDINTRLRALFPTVKNLSLKNPSGDTKALGVQLNDGTFVGAEFMSEGMLYYLAYAVLPHLEPAAVILIEEPENGLHPARVREVMSVLKEIAKTTQVVVATHSPLVINELEGDQVTVLTRAPEAGTTATLLSDTPNFEERSKVYALGELWVSYADGKLEAPLFTKPETPPDPGEPVEWSESNE